MHPNLSGIVRKRGSQKGTLEYCQKDRNSIVPEAEGAGKTKKTITNVTGKSGKMMTGKQIHLI